MIVVDIRTVLLYSCRMWSAKVLSTRIPISSYFFGTQTRHLLFHQNLLRVEPEDTCDSFAALAGFPVVLIYPFFSGLTAHGRLTLTLSSQWRMLIFLPIVYSAGLYIGVKSV